MKILITGNMGYVGPSVVRHLRQAHPDATLIGFDNGYFAHCLTNAEFLPECRVDLQHFADVRHVQAEVLRGVDAIVHLAAISNDPMGKTFEEVTYAINFRASVELAKQAKAAGVRSFVFASSCSMYGMADDTPRKETSPLNPLTAYAKSKVSTETELQKLADKNFRVTCLRFATACGMSDRLRRDLQEHHHPERWHPMAAADPREGHGEGVRVGHPARPGPGGLRRRQRRKRHLELP